MSDSYKSKEKYVFLSDEWQNNPIDMSKQFKFYGLALCSILLLIGAYWNHFENPFHFDDAHTIQNNEAIHSLKNIPSLAIA